MSQINKPDLSLSLTAQDIEKLTEQIIAQLVNAGDEVCSVPNSERSVKRTLLRWHEVQGDAAQLQTKCTLGAMVSTDKDVRAVSSTSKKLLKDAWDASYSRRDVYEVFVFLKSQAEDLDEITRRLLLKTLQLFERNGLGLPEDKLMQLIDIRKQICELENRFQQNLNEDTTSLLFTKQELEGCPDTFLEGLETVAGTDDNIMRYKVLVKPPQQIVVMQNAARADTRFRMLKTAQSKCLQENSSILKKLVSARHKAALLLGFPNHASFRLDINMAKSAEEAIDFLNSVAEKLKPKLHADLKVLSDLKREDLTKRGENFDGKVDLWDIAYYDNMLCKTKYNVDEEIVKEYFPMEHVTSEILAIYENLLGLKFEKLNPADAWSPEVVGYAVYDNSGSTNGQQELLGYFYLDLFPRPGKYSHQCVVPLAPTYIKDGHIIYPVACNIGNLSQPTGGRPALLRHSEVRTFFHEFGHVMHCLCSRSPYSLFSWAWSAVPYPAGVEMDTRSPYSLFSWAWSAVPYPAGVEMDYLEVPSQMLENWIWDSSVLKRLSKHYISGESLPDALIDGLGQSRKVNSGYFYSRQIFMSLFDMQIHNGSVNADEDFDLAQLWNKIQYDMTTLQMVEGTNPAANFYHLAMGYDAGYYSYLWSEVYSHDVFFKFKSSKFGCFDTELGRLYRSSILQPGATKDAIEMLQQFLGREPNHKAFLEFLDVSP